MATKSIVPQLFNKKGCSYSAIAPRLEPRKFNKWKKRMLCYLTGMEPYYIECIKEGPYQPKTVEDDIIDSVISCETAKATWTNLVHNFEGPSDTKQNRIMDLKLEYQTFKAKPTKSLSQTYTHYKTLLNELSNDSVTLSKHESNVGVVNSLLEKQPGPIKDFQENSDDEADERTNEEYLRCLELEFYERALLKNSKCFIKRKNNFDEKEVSDDEEMTQVKVLMALADDELSVGKNHARNGELIDITIRKVNILLYIDEDADWQSYLRYINIDLKFVEEQILNLLSKYNKIVFKLNKCRDDLLVLKQANLDAVTFQIQNTELTKLNYALQEQLK
ncbi:hypothetical protein Tco_0770676 [Tanacetum coccineum]|uniref:Uncharacterized protein n=1 Tax=Tanacetum coccineum TaxID=301880 RepID=A0ABQ4ZDX9_9ASTR